jgi:hypothetical protein
MNRDSKRPVTVEDLLQLKRAERPAPEFWIAFERDLRAKQLAALVEKRPWWQSLPRAFAGFFRYHLPIGATAIVALTFFSARHSQSASRPDAVVEATSAAAVAVPPVAHPAVNVAMPSVALDAIASTETNSPRAEVGAGAAALAVAPSATPLHVVPVFAMLAEPAAEESSPSARAIAANRLVAQAVDPELARRFLPNPRGFEARALPARQPAVEPLAQMSVSEARRARQSVAALPVAHSTNTASSEKIARRISDERLYDTVSRFGASGDRLKFKF